MVSAMMRALIFLLVAMMFMSFSVTAKDKNIVFIPKSNDQVFWHIMRSGVDEALHELGNINLTWRGPAYNDDTDSQIKILRVYTRPDVDAIIIAPTDQTRLVEPILKAVKLGIKVIVVDSALDGNYHQNFIATDNYAGGELAAKRLVDTLNHKGNVVLFRTVAGSASTEERAKGFLDYIAKNAPLVKVIADIYGGGSRGKDLRSATTLLQNTKRIDGIFAVNESASDGVLRALRNTGLAGKIVLVGFDSTDFLIEGLQKQDIDALIIQNPKQMGYLSIKAAAAAIDQKLSGQRKIYTEAKMVTKDNLQSPEIKQLICTRC